MSFFALKNPQFLMFCPIALFVSIWYNWIKGENTFLEVAI